MAQQQKSFESKLAEQETRIESLTSGLQKVSSQVELSELTRQVVLNKQLDGAGEQFQFGLAIGLGCGDTDLLLVFPRISAARCRSGSAFALSPVAS